MDDGWCKQPVSTMGWQQKPNNGIAWHSIDGQSDSQLQLVTIFNPGLTVLLQDCKHNNGSLTAFDRLIASLRPQVFSDLSSPLQTARARWKETRRPVLTTLQVLGWLLLAFHGLLSVGYWLCSVKPTLGQLDTDKLDTVVSTQQTDTAKSFLMRRKDSLKKPLGWQTKR